MTPCRNCKDGMDYSKPFLVKDIVTGESVTLFDVCSCCHGWNKDCPNCAIEFPNSVQAVQMGND